MSPPTGRSDARAPLATLRARSLPIAAVALSWALVIGLAAPVDRATAEPGSEHKSLAVAATSLGALAIAASSIDGTPVPVPERRISEGVLTRGLSLSRALRGQGVTPGVVNQIATGMRGHFDFRRAQPGHSYRLVQDSDGGIVEFTYRTSLTNGYTLTRRGDGFQVVHDEVELERRPTRIAGVVASTLYQSITNLGEVGQLASEFSDVFAWEIDFERSVQPGDSYQILYERMYRSAGGRDTYVRPGRILAARFQSQGEEHLAIYFEPSPGRGGYYRPDGTSVEGMFLMSPMSHGRITSNFNPARRHPILKVTRPHRGIDYAAPAGTPVWSVARGVVVHRGWQGANGNLVKVKHDNGYVSYYAHLSRFARDLRVGDRVDQKQVIGYVGQTGLATGPHVCFRVQRNGKFVNPADLQMPSGIPIPDELLPRFEERRDSLLAALAGQQKFAGTR